MFSIRLGARHLAPNRLGPAQVAQETNITLLIKAEDSDNSYHSTSIIFGDNHYDFQVSRNNGTISHEVVRSGWRGFFERASISVQLF